MPGDLQPARCILLNLMPPRTQRLSLLCVILSLTLGSLACQIDLGGPDRPGQIIQPDNTQATEVANIWAQAISDAVTSGQVTVLFNETQMTGFFAQRIGADQNALITAPQIFLRDGQIQVYGVVERGILKSAVLMRVEPRIAADGQLSLQLVEASVGPVPAPDFLMDTISAVLTEALTGSIGSFATGIKITSVAISNGEMAIVGAIR